MPPRFKTSKNKKIAGELRRSQTITTFGSGSIVDMPSFSGIVSGIDCWKIEKLPESSIKHDNNLEEMLGKDRFIQVSSPETEHGVAFAIPVFRFPEWYYCPNCHRLDNYHNLKQHVTNYSSDNVSKLCCNRCSTKDNKVYLIPSRFIVACINGHISDFPYSWWVHKGHPCEKKPTHPSLTLEYDGTTGGLRGIKIKCLDCGEDRTMEGCMSKDALKSLHCLAEMPWNGKDGRRWVTDPNKCDAKIRVLQRSANNVYYAKTQSALTIPPFSRRMEYAILANESAIRENTFYDSKEEIIIHLTKEYKMNIVDYLNSIDLVFKSSGASAERIADAETELSLNFSPEYRDYLSSFGRVVFEGHELTGISKSKRLSVVNATLTCKENNTVPDDFYVVEEAGIDGIVIWQNSSGEVFATKPGSEIAKLNDSLLEYIQGE